mgnify:CR=1 FL=1
MTKIGLNPFGLRPIFPLIAHSLSAQAKNRLAEQIGREDREREQPGDPKLACRQRHGAQNASAEIEKNQLDREDRTHDPKEGLVFSKPCGKGEAVCARIEAVEHRGKDEEPEKGGQMAEIRGGVAKLVGTETIACSASNMWACLCNTISWGIPEEEAVRAATYNPAKAIGAADVVGSIETGKQADFIVTTADYATKRVFIAGKEI